MLEHGGGLIAAAKKFKRPVDEWLDLSTGINPIPYAVPEIPVDIWRRLPQDDDELLEAAKAYYDTNALLAISGSQTGIQLIPQLIKQSKVGLMLPSYNEHKHAWSQAGHQIIELAHENLSAQCSQQSLDVLLLCNPNNPTGKLFSAAEIEECLKVLKARRGIVLVDEAFMDSTPGNSVLPLLAQFPDNLIVLRSLGKFFGLAGARVGFVAASPNFLMSLKEKLGPWTVSGPSRFVAHHALLNIKWQEANRHFLKEHAKQLCAQLNAAGFKIDGSTDYFAFVKHTDAKAIHESLCQTGVFTRYFETPASIRFGLPANDGEFSRLQEALKTVTQNKLEYQSIL